MSQRNYKRTAYGSTPYAFRLSGKTEDQYRKQLDAWITESMANDPELSTSQALREVVKGLVDRYIGHSLAASQSNAPVDISGLKESIISELKEWLSDTFSSPEKAAHLAKISQSAANGESIDGDIIDNIFEDFGRS